MIYIFTLIVAVLALFAYQVWSNTDSEQLVSPIKKDENVVFFLTHASFDEQKNVWHVPIHGWIYEPQNSHFRKEAFVKILKEKYGLETTPESEPRFNRLVNLLISDNERGKAIVIKIANQVIALPESEPNGHFATVLEIPANDIVIDENALLHYEAVTRSDEIRKFHGQVKMLLPQGESVISDIDDTVKYSHVTDKKALIEHTFFKPFTAIEGMPLLYQQWQQQGKSIHFVSSSPWYIYEPLQEFMRESGFPLSTLSLKSFRFRDASIMNLFKKGTETKPIAIEAILNAYPQRTFTLVGDSGEQDPEVYADIAKRYPNQIKHIYIRRVPDTDRDFETIFSGLNKDIWQVFDVAEEINR